MNQKMLGKIKMLYGKEMPVKEYGKECDIDELNQKIPKMTKSRASKMTKRKPGYFKINTPSKKFLMWITKNHKKVEKRPGSSKKKYSLSKNRNP